MSGMGQTPKFRTKGAPSTSITQRITRVLGTLCQEPGSKIKNQQRLGTETNIHSSYYFTYTVLLLPFQQFYAVDDSLC